ncbi:MAG: hypothetical protein ABIV50_03965 [Opitutus sp.]
MRTTQAQRSWLNIAFVWLEATRQSVLSDHFQRQTIEAVRSRSDELGLNLEQFFLAESDMTPARLEQILQARGISGIIFSPSSNIPIVRLPFNWSRFSIVIIGNTPWEPNFHRAAHHHYSGMCRALEEVHRYGYRRPGVVLVTNLNERAGRGPEAAFLTHCLRKLPAQNLIFRISAPRPNTDFRHWLNRMRPDCLLFPFYEGYMLNIGGFNLQASYPHAALDIFGPGTVAGIHQDFDAIGANAVDLLMTQLLHNDRGAPRRAKIVLAEGVWTNGASLQPLRSRKFLL